MAGSDRSSLVPRPGRLRGWADHARHRLGSWRPAVWWTVSVGALVVLGALAALSSFPLGTSKATFLRSGRRFASSDLIKICRALDHQRIDYRIDEQRRVTVSANQLDLAETAIAKLELGPRSLDELRDQATASSLLESPREKELREHQGQEKILESMIRDLPGIVGSFVWINRPRTRLGLRPSETVSAFVRLETEGDCQLPFRTVQSISTILVGYEPGLKPEAITVVDRRGHKYLDAGNPALTAFSHHRAREEELSQQILEKLDWIKGVRVSVQLPELSAVPGSDGIPLRERGEIPFRGDSDQRGANPGGAATSTAPWQAPAVGLNRPMSLGPPLPAARSDELPGSSVSAAARPEGSGKTHGNRGKVWVKVPRSYYYHVGISPAVREPSQDELQKLVSRTEEQVRTGIGLVVPVAGPDAWETRVDVIPDELPLQRPPVVETPTASRDPSFTPALAGGVGIVAAVLFALGAWWYGRRRPSARDRLAASARTRVQRGASRVASPSRRVREFVRRNPEVAAGVVQRWIHEGGRES
jgi:flagellar M-ring protein FliF